MGILCIIVVLAMSGWSLVALFRRLRRQRTRLGRWLVFGVLVACGVVVGIWCAFSVEYHVGSRCRIASFPIPVVFFHLENGDWVDFPVPKFQAWAAMFANVITITALATLPLWLVSWRQNRHESTHTAA
jgi:amino acid transporter